LIGQPFASSAANVIKASPEGDVRISDGATPYPSPNKVSIKSTHQLLQSSAGAATSAGSIIAVLTSLKELEEEKFLR